MAMPTDAAHLHKLNAWFSPSYPVGAFSYSHGLEAVVSAGEVGSAEQLCDWLSDCLWHGAGRNDAIFLAHAYRAEDRTALLELAELAVAMAASAERHLETTAQGAAFSKVTESVWGGDLGDLPYPVAVGAAARAEGIPLDLTLSLYLHAFAANIIAAGVRFIPLGQTDGQQVLARLFPAFDAIATEAAGATLDDLGSATFRADLASMQHETLRTRIFRS
jgi:urease accessory protein